MTPTQAQIEAAARAIQESFDRAGMLRPKELAEIALTAAAQVGPLTNVRPIYPGDWKRQMIKDAQRPSPPLTAAAQVGEDDLQERILRHGREVMAGTIERCAQVAESFKSDFAMKTVADAGLIIAAAIRALKEGE